MQIFLFLQSILFFIVGSVLQAFASNLQQTKDENEEISGYTLQDVTAELKRAARLSCFYCKLRGASIGCCKRQCRKSFHFPCALKHNCLTKFIGNFESFCHLHHSIERSIAHNPNETCRLCHNAMNNFNPVHSLELPCCDSRWFHRDCIRKEAFEKAADFCCFVCKDVDVFRQFILSNGVFIPTK